MEQETDIEKMALIAKSIGNELRMKLYKILIENKGREIQIFELSKMVEGSYRNVQIHLQFLEKAGIVKINSESYPASVRILICVQFFEQLVMKAKKEGFDKFIINETEMKYSSPIGGFEEITNEEEIIRIAKSLSHPTRLYIMQIINNYPGSNIPRIEKFLRGTRYESSYRNVSQHIDKLTDAGIAKVVMHLREKFIDLNKIVKIRTYDVK